MGLRPRILLSTSVFKKQIVAITSIFLVLYIIGHLAGNLLIFAGPEAFNAYAEKLHDLGGLLWVARIVLLAAFVLHVYFTIKLAQENRKAGLGRYAVANPKGDWPFARRTMIYTGLLVFFFFFVHLNDFTFADAEGEHSVVMTSNGEANLGLYGLVWNSFLDPFRAVFYVLAVFATGFHLSHGVQSLFQSLGLDHPRYTPTIRRLSVIIGAIVAVGFALIPVYVIIRHLITGVGA